MTKNIYCNDFQNKLTLQCSVFFFFKINSPGCAVSTLHNRNVSPIRPSLVHIFLNNLYRKRNIQNYFRLKIRVFDNYQAEVWLYDLYNLTRKKKSVSAAILYMNYWQDFVWIKFEMKCTTHYRNLMLFSQKYPIQHVLFLNIIQSIKLKRGLLTFFNYYFCRMIYLICNLHYQCWLV